MGYLTTITISNDRLNEFEQNPLEFAKTIFDGIRQANDKQKMANLHGNYIKVQHSRHADDVTVYVHYGNTALNLNPYSKDLEALIENMPIVAIEFIKAAEDIVKRAKKKLNEC
jgi:hypothetical protein